MDYPGNKQTRPLLVISAMNKTGCYDVRNYKRGQPLDWSFRPLYGGDICTKMI